jgi:hypothetical protein
MNQKERIKLELIEVLNAEQILVKCWHSYDVNYDIEREFLENRAIELGLYSQETQSVINKFRGE